MCLDLGQRRFGANRVATPLPTAATGPSEAAMGNHTGESPQGVSIVRTDVSTDAASRLTDRTRITRNVEAGRMKIHGHSCQAHASGRHASAYSERFA
jgi:hypothetical protein